MVNLFVLGARKVGSAVVAQANFMIKADSMINLDSIGINDTRGYVYGPLNQEEISKLVEHKLNKGSIADLVEEDFPGENNPEALLDKINEGDIVINTLPTKFCLDDKLYLSTKDVEGSIKSLKENGLVNVAYDIEELKRGATVLAAHKDYFVDQKIWTFMQELAEKYSGKLIPAGIIMAPCRVFEVINWLQKNNVKIISAEGILSSTCNSILSGMEEKLDYKSALDKTIEEGIAEPDSKADETGQDALMKTKAMGILLGCYKGDNLYGAGESLDVSKKSTGIVGIDRDTIKKFNNMGYTIRLICSLDTKDGIANVGPRRLSLYEYFAEVKGPTNALSLAIDGRFDFKQLVSQVYDINADKSKAVVKVPYLDNRKESFYEVKLEIIGDNSKLLITGPGGGNWKTAAGLLSAAYNSLHN